MMQELLQYVDVKQRLKQNTTNVNDTEWNTIYIMKCRTNML